MRNGNLLQNLAVKLWPLNRSIAGKATHKSLKIIKNIIPKLKIKKVESGKKIYDWKIPYEWEVNKAMIIDKEKKVVVDYNCNNLHLVTFSKSFSGTLSNKDLKKKIYTIKNLPNAIPYRTSYYKKDWGFCVSFKNFKKLNDPYYNVLIKTKFKKGYMRYGEIFIKGKSKQEIILSTNICHPSLANNELSGPVVMTYIAKLILKKKNRYSYRLLFIPETIGSLAYLFENLEKMKKNFVAGFNCVCLGYKKGYSYLPSKNQDSTANYLALKALKKNHIKFKKYTWLDRGSDERQYCSPRANLDFASLMTTKYGDYKEYHTSLDKLGSTVDSKGLFRGYKLIKDLIISIEEEIFPISNFIGEPQMGKRNMYPTTGGGIPNKSIRNFMNVISYCDGKTPSELIAEKCKIKKSKMKKILILLKKKKIIKF